VRIAYYLFILNIVFTSSEVFCQENNSYRNLDNIYIQVNALSNDSSKVLKLADLSSEYLDTQLDSALILGQRALDLSEKLNYKYGIAISLFQLGTILGNLANYDKAIEYSLISYDLFNKMGKLKEKARVLNSLGNINRKAGKYKESLEYFLISLQIYSELNDSVKIAGGVDNLGTLYQELRDYDKSLEYFFKSLEIRQKLEMDNELILINLMNLGIVYNLKNDNLKALNYYQEAINLIDGNTSKFNQAILLHNVAIVYSALGKYKSAKSYYLESVKIKEKIGALDYIITSWLGLGGMLVYEGNYKEGQKYLLKAYKLAKEQGSLKKLRKASEYLVWASEIKKDYKKALYHQKMFQQLSDSLLGIEKIKLVKEVEQKYDAEKKEQLIAYLEKEQEIQNLNLSKRTSEAKQKSLQRNLLIVIILMILVIVIFLLTDNKKRKNRNKILLRKNRTILDQRTEIVCQNDNLLESNKTKDKLFQIIAHDLRSPLVSIDSFTQLIPYWVEEQDYNSLKKMAKTMELSVENVLSLIDDLLNWALGQQGKFPFNPEKFKIIETLEEAIKVYLPIAEIKNINLKITSVEESHVFADKNMFLTVIRNLLNNAIKFTPENGKVEVGVEYEKEFAKVWVKDSGIGIPDDKKEKIFEFANANSKGTKGEVGKGLGLFFCKEFVHLNKGDVYVESELDKGTTITITLPRS